MDVSLDLFADLLARLVSSFSTRSQLGKQCQICDRLSIQSDYFFVSSPFLYLLAQSSPKTFSLAHTFCLSPLFSFLSLSLTFSIGCSNFNHVMVSSHLSFLLVSYNFGFVIRNSNQTLLSLVIFFLFLFLIESILQF